MSASILVSGATGQTGSALVRELAGSGRQVRALVRDPEKAASLGNEQVAIVKGEFGDPASLDAALDGIERAFLVSGASLDMEAQQKNFVDAARRAGVKHLVKLSAIGVSEDAPFQLGRAHRAVEKHIEDSGIDWTHLRPGMFMQNLLMSAPSVQAEGTIHSSVPSGRIAFIDARDIAAAARTILGGEGHAGKIYTLLGPESLNYADLAAQLGKVLGRELRFQPVSHEDARRAMLGLGLPGWLADDLIKLNEAGEMGYLDGSDSELRALLDREPSTFTQFAADHAAAFQSARGEGA